MRARDAFDFPGRRTFRCDNCSKRLAEVWPTDGPLRWDAVIYVDRRPPCDCDRHPFINPPPHCLAVTCPRCQAEHHHVDVMGELYGRLRVRPA